MAEMTSGQLDAAPSTTRTARLWPHLKTLAWFAFAGPPIGALVFAFCLAMTVAVEAGQVGQFGSLFLFLVLYGLPFSHVVGLAPAMAAGLVVVYWQVCRGPVNARGALAIGAAIGVAAVIVLRLGAQPGGGLSFVACCMVSTLACWRLSRPRQPSLAPAVPGGPLAAR